MELTVNTQVVISGATTALRRLLKDRFTFDNPAYLDAQKHGRYTGKIPLRLTYCREHHDGSMSFPGGAMRDIDTAVRKWGHVAVIDERRTLPEVDFTFAGGLRDYQTDAVHDVLGSDFGTLEAGTGSGKTVMALNIIAERRQPALVIVHTKELLHQWVSRAQQFLDLEPGEIGIFGDGKKVLGDRLTIGMVQTLRGCVDQVADHVGHVIIDEVHHVLASTFKDVLSAVDCRYQLGLTATPYRRDGLGKLIEWFVGPVVHRVARGRLMDTGAILRPQIITRRTDFWGRTDPAA
jgi:superfamily II DNA or RNA helicase